MKPFYLYILRCSDGSYYVGHTDELEKRIAEHEDGSCGWYTVTRRPVELVFVEEFVTRIETLERERQIKGWSRKKKEALIRGDWNALKRLASSYSECAPSTGSGRRVGRVGSPLRTADRTGGEVDGFPEPLTGWVPNPMSRSMKEHVPSEHAAAIGLPASTPAKYLKILDAAEPGLVVHEIYASVQGESTHAGRPCTFVRLSACHLRCSYCDTPHAFGQGERMSRERVLEQVKAIGIELVELTGGEPLLQAEVLPLMTELCDAGHEVLLETSGSLDIRPVDPRVKRIVDLKTPSSGEEASNRWDNLDALRRHDEIKIVIGSREDYEWTRDRMSEYALSERCTVLVGCVHDALDPQHLIEWMLADRLPARFQLQMHKFIWDPNARGV